jgi:hypothetical protein
MGENDIGLEIPTMGRIMFVAKPTNMTLKRLKPTANNSDFVLPIWCIFSILRIK